MSVIYNKLSKFCKENNKTYKIFNLGRGVISNVQGNSSKFYWIFPVRTKPFHKGKSDFNGVFYLLVTRGKIR